MLGLLLVLSVAAAVPTYYDNRQRTVNGTNGIGKFEDIAIIIDPRPIVNEKTIPVAMATLGRNGEAKGLTASVFEKLIKLMTLGQFEKSGDGVEKFGRFLGKAIDVVSTDEEVKTEGGTPVSRRKRQVYTADSNMHISTDEELNDVEGSYHEFEINQDQDFITQLMKLLKLGKTEKTSNGKLTLKHYLSESLNSDGRRRLRADQGSRMIRSRRDVPAMDREARSAQPTRYNFRQTGTDNGVAKVENFAVLIDARPFLTEEVLATFGFKRSPDSSISSEGKSMPETAFGKLQQLMKQGDADQNNERLARLDKLLDVALEAAEKGKQPAVVDATVHRESRGKIFDSNVSPNDIPRISHTRTQHFTRGPQPVIEQQSQMQGINVNNKYTEEKFEEESSEEESAPHNEQDDDEDQVPYEPTIVQNSPEESLTLIGSSVADCGPDGHRNQEGICVYTTETETV